MPPMLSQAELQRFEAPLIALANASGGDLRKLFYAFFSFLHRRTDFYCILPDDGTPTTGGGGGGGGRMGFREGQAEQILLASFRQFPLRKVGPKPSSAGGGGGAPAAKKSNATNAPVNDTTKKEEPATKKEEPTAKSTPKADEQSPPASKSKDDGSGSTDIEKDNNKTDETAKEKAGKPKNDTIRYTEDGKQIPIGNGGSTSRYVWTQTLEEATVHIPLPEGIRAKDLDVRIGATTLSIRQKGTPSPGSAQLAPLEGTLFAKIKPSESTWTLESTTHNSQEMTTLQLILDKVQKTWWATVISGDTPLIDTTLVDSTRHIGTYDDETQGQIRRIMFDQQQERLGKPTSQKIMLDNLPPMPGGRKLGELPNGCEFIDGNHPAFSRDEK